MSEKKPINLETFFAEKSGEWPTVPDNVQKVCLTNVRPRRTSIGMRIERIGERSYEIPADGRIYLPALPDFQRVTAQLRDQGFEPTSARLVAANAPEFSSLTVTDDPSILYWVMHVPANLGGQTNPFSGETGIRTEGGREVQIVAEDNLARVEDVQLAKQLERGGWWVFALRRSQEASVAPTEEISPPADPTPPAPEIAEGSRAPGSGPDPEVVPEPSDAQAEESKDEVTGEGE